MEVQMTAEFESGKVARLAVEPFLIIPANAGSSPRPIMGRMTRQSEPSRPTSATLSPVSSTGIFGAGLAPFSAAQGLPAQSGAAAWKIRPRRKPPAAPDLHKEPEQ